MKKRGDNTAGRILQYLINAVIGVAACIGVSVILLFLCGIRIYVVVTRSMEPQLSVGSICLVNQRYDFPKIRSGDIVTFRAADTTFVTHRAVRIQDDLVYTKGDSNSDEDEAPVTRENYIGKCILNVPKIGLFVQFLRSRYGLLSAAGMILLLILLDQIADKHKNKNEFTEENAHEEVE